MSTFTTKDPPPKERPKVSVPGLRNTSQDVIQSVESRSYGVQSVHRLVGLAAIVRRHADRASTCNSSIIHSRVHQEPLARYSPQAQRPAPDRSPIGQIRSSQLFSIRSRRSVRRRASISHLRVRTEPRRATYTTITMPASRGVLVPCARAIAVGLSVSVNQVLTRHLRHGHRVNK